MRNTDVLCPQDDLIGASDDDASGGAEAAWDTGIGEEIGQLPGAALEASRPHAISRLDQADVEWFPAIDVEWRRRRGGGRVEYE